MPATAGRVRMPANNRVHSSAALQTHGIWQSAIGYDPYAPNKEEDKIASQPKASSSEQDADNAYNNFQGLLALARSTGSNADEARGSCKRCGWVGHLSFQCRNFLSTKDDKDKDLSGDLAAGLSELKKRKNADESSDEEEESESSDSDYDSEIEKVIAKRTGRSGKMDILVKKTTTKEEDDSDSDSDSGKRKKRGRSKKKKKSGKRREDSDDSDDGKRKSKKKSKKRDESESSDEEDERRRRRHRKSRKEKRRRRSHRDDSDSDSDSDSLEDSERRRKRKSRRSPDSGSRDERRVGGRGMKRSEKSRKRRYDDEE